MWRLSFTRSAKKELRKLDKSVAAKILSFLEARMKLVNPLELAKPLSGNKFGLWSYRIGKIRVIMEVINDEVTIMVVKVGHRQHVYKDQQ